jgi:Ca2+-binding EF-hand superfamily protein
MFGAVPALASDLSRAAEDMGDALAEVLAPQTLSKMRDNPERFVRSVAELILGQGRNGSIGAEEIETHIALERAYWRARELRRFLLADLNGDGDISAMEMSALAATQSARQRGKSILSFRAADRNADGVLSWAEQRVNAEALAQEKLSDEEAELLRGLLGLDLNKDGRLSLEELDTAVFGQRS